MEARLRSWWQKINQHRVAIGVGAIVCVVVIVIIIIGYQFDWTGFNGYNKVTTTHIVSGANAGTVTRTEEYQPGKGLWDWLGLLGVLAIPVVVGLGAAWFTVRHNHDIEIARAQHENDIRIALDDQRQAMLQTYIDKMAELLLHENLGQSKRGDAAAIIAEARTLTVLPKLDPARKRSIIEFLSESRLIERDKWIIDMSFVDLRSVDLSEEDKLDSLFLPGAYLQGANLYKAFMPRAYLQGANLRQANLTDAKLFQANLSETDLREAILTNTELDQANLYKSIVTMEQLNKAKSLKGATMPDGSKHE